MAGKSFREDHRFRLAGLIIIAGWLGTEAIRELWPYLHLSDSLAMAIILLHAAFRLAFFVWMAIFTWRWWRGAYRAEFEEQRAQGKLPNAKFSLLFWIGVAVVLVFVFNVIPEYVKDSHVAGLITTVGPLLLLIAIWIGAFLWMRRGGKRDSK
ncbi:hypothetical protein FHS83_000985 [Rhizomicrobium palustre]|uniref:Transmembrane protein n=1 Tax=Rhizomicrobium palustre TaxID=189966 RepID=A0A846MXF7_9PROT|nr:hypothetical protein [Rhizomicrobium palustre]NIK87667.1 hypothetical protein [Rhizomicrobium palustre]